MVLQYAQPDNRELLAEIEALAYFDVACEGDVLSRQIAEEVFGDDDSLQLLRFYRQRLVAGYNVFHLISNDEQIELE